MAFEGFSTVDFRPINQNVPGFVYVWCWVDGSECVPFYVGRTERLWGRLDDYYWAMFSAATDFRVGEAIRHLGAKGYRVVVKYKSSAHPMQEESELIRDLEGEGRKLMNRNLLGSHSNHLQETEERVRIQNFIDGLLHK